jgi:hypothetical protein
VITIRLGEEHYPLITLRIPHNLKTEAIAFTNEFPGIWSWESSPYGTGSTFKEVNWRSPAFLINLMGFGLLPLSVNYLQDQNPVINVLAALSLSLGLFLIGWPFIMVLVRLYIQEKGIGTNTIRSSLIIIPLTLLTWGISLNSAGKVAITLLKLIGIHV